MDHCGLRIIRITKPYKKKSHEAKSHALGNQFVSLPRPSLDQIAHVEYSMHRELGGT